MPTPPFRRISGHSRENRSYIPPDYDRVPDWGAGEGQGSNWRHYLLTMLNEIDPEKIVRAARALEDALFIRYWDLGTTLKEADWAFERSEMRSAAKLLRSVLLDKLHYGQTENVS
jgi:hypothetical protein